MRWSPSARHRSIAYAQEFWKRYGGILKVIFVASALATAIRALIVAVPQILTFGAPQYLALAFLIAMAAFLVISLRFRVLAAAFDVTTTVKQAFAINLIGLFYFIATPAAIGLDIARTLRLRFAVPGTTFQRATFIVILDRLLGLIAVVIMAGATAPIAIPQFKELIGADHEKYFLLGATALLSIILGIVGVMLVTRYFASADWYTNLGRLSWPALLLAFLYSCVAQGLLALAIKIGGYSFGIQILFLQVFCAISGSMIFSIVPVSFFGIGAAQMANFGLYLLMGLTEGQAIILTLLTYAYHLGAGAVGGLIEIAWANPKEAAGTKASDERP